MRPVRPCPEAASPTAPGCGADRKDLSDVGRAAVTRTKCPRLLDFRCGSLNETASLIGRNIPRSRVLAARRICAGARASRLSINRLGEFPAEQPNDLRLSATAEAFYRSGPLFWQRYTSFWISSLLSRIVFFVIPVLAALIPVVGFTLSFYRWLHIRRAGRLSRALGKLKSARYSEPRNLINEPDESSKLK
jgi:hypothetical protein